MTKEKKLEVLEEALNYYQDRTSLTNEDEKELQTFFNELKETILVTRCCDKLKDKEKLTFDEWLRDENIKMHHDGSFYISKELRYVDLTFLINRYNSLNL